MEMSLMKYEVHHHLPRNHSEAEKTSSCLSQQKESSIIKSRWIRTPQTHIKKKDVATSTSDGKFYDTDESKWLLRPKLNDGRVVVVVNKQQTGNHNNWERTSFKGHRPEILQQSGVWINGSPKPLRELITTTTTIITKLTGSLATIFTLPCLVGCCLYNKFTIFGCGNKFGA